MSLRRHAALLAADHASPDVPPADTLRRPALRLVAADRGGVMGGAARGEMAGAEAADAAAVTRVLAGDVEAYAGLVRRYHAPCLRYAERVLGDRADAEDAVQDAFVRAYDALARYEERAHFRAWLFTILATECRSYLRGRARRARVLVRDEAAASQAAAPEPTAAPDARARLDRALARLEPRLREAFLLRHVAGLGYEEMQVATGANVSALKMRVKRACDALRAHLEAP